MDLSQYMALVGWYFINVRYFIKKKYSNCGNKVKKAACLYSVTLEHCLTGPQKDYSII